MVLARQPLIRRGSLNIILVLGVNGVGKTTTIAKLAHHYHTVVGIPEVMLAAADTFRAAAVEQLKLWGDEIGVPVVAQRPGADPGAVAFGMVSRGGPNHLALSQAVLSAGVDPRKLKTVVFKTNAESHMAVVGGHIQAVVSSVSAALPQVQAGHTRMLAIAAPQRAAGPLASLPTMREQGISATGISNWRAIFGVKGMTSAQASFWENALSQMAASEEWNRELDGTNMSRLFLRGKEFARYLDEEYAATRSVMTDLGLIK